MSSDIPRYSDREEIFNAATHWCGVLLLLPMAAWIPADVSAPEKTAWGFYFFTLLFMFCASASYHSVKSRKNKALCRKLDHCAIYLLITGTYAPLMTVLFPDWRGMAVMATLGVLTAMGITIKLCCDSRIFHRIEVGIFLLMGWLCILLARPMIISMPRNGLLLLLCGGLAYSGGVIFYVIKKEFFHAVWHVFVLAGAILQLAAVLTLR